MRRFTLIAIILLFLMIAIAAYFQVRAARGPRRFPGPGVSTPGPTPSPTTSAP
ncbi:MAG: hypothetical protein ACRDGU_00905 [Actinomycetota bacterium]